MDNLTAVQKGCTGAAVEWAQSYALVVALVVALLVGLLIITLVAPDQIQDHIKETPLCVAPNPAPTN